MDLKEVECKCMDWIQMAQDGVQWWAPVKTVLNLWLP